MKPILGSWEAPLYAVLRIIAGLLFAMHGIQKLFGWPGGQETVAVGSLPFVAGVIELVAGLMILLGFFTSIAAFIASGEMAVAYFMVHFPQAFWPIQNQGETAALFCFIFLYFAARGSGTFSIDNSLRKSEAGTRK